LRLELGGEPEGAAEAARVQQQAEPVAAADESWRRGVHLVRPPGGVVKQARDLVVVRLVREQVAALLQERPHVLQGVPDGAGQVGVDVSEHEVRVEPGQGLAEESLVELADVEHAVLADVLLHLGQRPSVGAALVGVELEFRQHQVLFVAGLRRWQAFEAIEEVQATAGQRG
jgi:hypothetical protein